MEISRGVEDPRFFIFKCAILKGSWASSHRDYFSNKFTRFRYERNLS